MNNEIVIPEGTVDRVANKTNVVMDATLLTSLMSCPRYTDLRFNHNLVPIGGKSNSLEVGSIVHVYLENYYKSIINKLDKSKAQQFGLAAAELYIRGCKFCTGFTPSINCSLCVAKIGHDVCDAPNILKPVCGHKPNDYPGVTNTPEKINKDNPKEKYLIGWRWALDTVEQYLDYYKNDYWVPLFVETVKGKVLFEDDDIRVLWKAKLDLGVDTNQGIFPVDHKTMKQNRSTMNLNNQFVGQCLIMNSRSVIINKIGFQTTLPPEEKFKRDMVNYSVPRLIEWQREILPYYAKLLIMYNEVGYWPPNFDHCEGKYGKCIFASEYHGSVCEADPVMREEVLKKYFMIGPVWNPTNEDE